MFFRCGRIERGVAVAQHLLHAANRIAFLIEQAVDAADELDVGRPIVTAVARALHRAKLRKARFPIAQDVLGDAQFLRQFPNRQ